MSRIEWFVLFAICFLLSGGCVAYQPGEAKIIRSSTTGIKIKMFGESVDASPIVLYLGYNETQFIHCLKTEVDVGSNHKDLNLWKASGSISRRVEVKP